MAATRAAIPPGGGVTRQGPRRVDGHGPVPRARDNPRAWYATFVPGEVPAMSFHRVPSICPPGPNALPNAAAGGRCCSTSNNISVRFSYDAIFTETVHCVKQLQDICRQDPLLARYCVPNPTVVVPPLPMSNRLLGGLTSTLRPPMAGSYFAEVRRHLSPATLRTCQQEAWGALANYYGSGARNAACVMAVGAGKTVLGVLACLGFAERRALIITPGNVIKGTFDRALDAKAPGNVLYGLPDGPLIPGCPPPRVLTLDRQEGSISRVSRPRLLEADILLTNFHALGDAQGQDALLGKLGPTDIDFIVVDEAHIAAAPSYQRVFAHFAAARTLLMSACFQRVDGKPIEADVVYRYRLLDAIMDGNAKELRLGRYAPEDEATIYEVHWPDGRVEEIIGREALLEAEQDERRLALITAKSTASIRAMARWARVALDRQAEALRPIKPRVLFSALGERHAAQIARVGAPRGGTMSWDAGVPLSPGRPPAMHGDRAVASRSAGGLCPCG